MAMKKNSLKFILMALPVLLIAGIFPADTNIFGGIYFDETQLMTPETMKLIKSPDDYRNCFFLQSIDDTTMVLIGDFSSTVRMVTLIIDEGSDNTIDYVFEYFPDTGSMKKREKPTTPLFNTDLAQFKRDIIEGSVYEKKYSYEMKTISVLRSKLEKLTDVFKHHDGYNVIVYDPDKTSTPMHEFFFRYKNDRYDLMFKTNFYKLYNTTVVPPINHSVFCRNSKDPVVAKYVKELLDMAPR
jgi:hypothetical protein